MTIGLVDIDGHAKKKKWGATIYPNLALAKIARYHRERAMDMINSYGFTGQYFLYTMIGGKNDFHECYDRINYWWKRCMEVREKHQGHYVYPHAQPYRDPDNPDAPIPQWQKDLAGWVNKKAHFIAHSFAEFRPRKGFTCNQYLQTLY